MTPPDSISARGREVLQELPALRFLPQDARDLVIRSFVPVSFSFGETIVKEGADADAFYVLVSGRARVIKSSASGEEISLNVLRAGEGFGEMGLLDEKAQRTATIRASGDVEVLRLDRGVFQALLASDPRIRTSFELQGRHRSLHTFFRLYGPFTQLPPAALAALLAEFQVRTAAPGEVIFRQADPPGPLFVVEDGRLRAFAETDGERRPLAYLRKGDFFGEVSVFTGAPRTATVEAVSACRLLTLPEAAFQKVAAEHEALRTSLKTRIEQYDYQHVARVPFDFAEELLPAETSVREVSKDQVDHDEEAETPADAAAPFASEEGHFIKRPKRIRRFPLVQQIDEMDCGAACVAMICRHYGRAVSLTRIRQLLFTSTDGTSLRAICRGAEELGLAARSVKASARNLEKMPLPAILHWGGNHWVVLYDVSSTHVRVADPATGLKRLPRERLEKEWSGYAALFDYTLAFEKAPIGRTSFGWLGAFFRPHATVLLQAAALALVVSGLQMVFPIFTQVVVDRVLVERDASMLSILLLVMLGVLAFSTFAMVLQRYLLSFAAVRIDSALLDFATRRLLSLPMSYFSARRTGDIQRRLQGLRGIREMLVQQGVQGLSAAAQLLVALVLMFLYSPYLGTLFLATAPVYALLMRVSATRMRPVFAALEEAFGKYSARQIDAIKGIETVKAVGAESALRRLMLGRFLGLARTQFNSDFTMMTYTGAVQAVTFLSLALFLWAGAREVLAGSLTIGGLVAFNALVGLANGPIGTMLGIWDHAQLGVVLLDRLNDVFEPEPEQGSDRSRLLPVRTLEGRVRFENLGFRYGGPEAPPILENISFEVKPGTTVAIVGRSGSGKTTLVKCLCGLLEPTEGTIYFDGVDLKTLNYRDLRRRVGFVLQENYLFDDTIARNLALGEDEPDMDRVLWAARVANAHEFVDRLPLGYETPVGESGLSLSGGQKQRIAIGRAVYNDPPILVFDEATSALDTESERAVKENMDRLLRDRTSFVIAHRLSTIRDAGVILVLERGRLVEQGTHEELMARQGLYYYLCSQQLTL